VNIHKNARLAPVGRLQAVARVHAGETISAVAEAVGVSRQTLYKWVRRENPADATSCHDRSSRPRRMPTRLARGRRRQIARLRRQRWSSPRIARELGVPISTVVVTVRRLGLARLDRLEPPRPIIRYERDYPGELVHLDIKKLGRIGQLGHRMHGDRRRRARGVGYEYTHVAIDDHSRVSYAEVLRDERGDTTAGFLTRAVAWFLAQGIRVERILTDNGSAYRSHVFAERALALGISQRFTRPYRPQTNGKAERFIRILLTEWAYAHPYHHSRWRTAALARYLSCYNTARPHGGIHGQTPVARLLTFL
jgi:transposase InsO family protein